MKVVQVQPVDRKHRNCRNPHSNHLSRTCYRDAQGDAGVYLDVNAKMSSFLTRGAHSNRGDVAPKILYHI